MARIPDDVVERLKREVSVVRLVEASGVELKRHGENVMGRCPFHDDKTPSLVVTPSKNLWHCLGACQAGGSVGRGKVHSYRARLSYFLTALSYCREGGGGVKLRISHPIRPTLPRTTSSCCNRRCSTPSTFSNSKLAAA